MAQDWSSSSRGVRRRPSDCGRTFIDFGSDSDRATWESVAQISGGAYQNLASSTGPS